MTKVKLAIVNNFLPPYRVPVFDHFASDPDFETRAFLLGTKQQMRTIWGLDGSGTRKNVVQLPGVGIKIRDRSADRIFFNPGFSRITSWDPDAVLIFGNRDITIWMVALVCRLRRIPYVLVVDTTSGGGRSMSGRFSLPIMRALISSASYLVPSSKTAQEFLLANGGSADRCKIVPIVPDVRLFEVSERMHAIAGSVREELGFQGKTVVFFVGRLVREKGVRELIEAIDVVSKANDNVEFLIVGDGPLRSDVEEFCKSHPEAVRYMGLVDDETLYRLFGIADIHVMPSYAEAFGVVCTEAMAFGVPSIVTSTSGCADLIVDGESGRLIRPRDASDLAKAILEMASDRTRLGAMKARAFKIAKGTTSEDVQRELKSIILEVANRRAE